MNKELIDDKTEQANAQPTFIDFLADYKGGRLNEELTMELNTLVQEVSRLGAAGEFTLSFKIKPNGMRTVEIADKVTVKAPQEPRATAIHFPDANGSLFRDDPYQTSIRTNA